MSTKFFYLKTQCGYTHDIMTYLLVTDEFQTSMTFEDFLSALSFLCSPFKIE